MTHFLVTTRGQTLSVGSLLKQENIVYIAFSLKVNKDRVKVYANSFSFLDFFPNIMDLIYHVKITVLLTVELIVQISTK